MLKMWIIFSYTFFSFLFNELCEWESGQKKHNKEYLKIATARILNLLYLLQAYYTILQILYKRAEFSSYINLSSFLKQKVFIQKHQSPFHFTVSIEKKCNLSFHHFSPQTKHFHPLLPHLNHHLSPYLKYSKRSTTDTNSTLPNFRIHHLYKALNHQTPFYPINQMKIIIYRVFVSSANPTPSH